MAAKDEIRPGYKTTEFWLSATAAVVGLLLASGVVPSQGVWTQIIGLLVSALTAMGYSVSRAKTKS